MDIFRKKGSLVTIKVLLPTPLPQEATNAVKKSEIKITTD